jgi:NADH-quinone oxidoreductase subunit C
MSAVFERARERLGQTARDISVGYGTLVVHVARSDVLATAQCLQQELGFDMMLDVTAVDWPADPDRFEVVWHFYSTRDFARVRMKTRVTEADPVVESLTALYGSAGFMERECHEMYGIDFRGNADLRPVLLYEGFVGHPLRKDYPKDRQQPLIPLRDVEGRG